LVFIKKNNQTEIFFEKKTKTRSNRPVSVWFGFLGQKPVQTGLAQFFRFWLGFLGFGSVFSGFGSVFFVLARFFRFGLVLARFGSVFCRFRFGFFDFLLIKPNRIGRFFQKFNRFLFFGSVFSVIFFRFSWFNRFSGFFAHADGILSFFFLLKGSRVFRLFEYKKH